jgi:hypothetical protein
MENDAGGGVERAVGRAGHSRVVEDAVMKILFI